MIEIFPVNLSAFKEDRLIRVYVPKNYQSSNDRYPVLFMHDGQNVFKDEDAIGGVSLGLETYLEAHELDVIVVAIDQNSNERFNEYCPWENGDYSRKLKGPDLKPFGGKGVQYVEFIVNELKPLIDEKYRTRKDYTSMSGISLGGLITTYAVCKYPHIFKHAAILSSGYYANQEEFEKLVRNSDLSEVNSFYMDAGTQEAGEGTFMSTEFLASNTAVYEILKDKLPHIRFDIIDGGVHNYTNFRDRVAALFSFLHIEE